MNPDPDAFFRERFQHMRKMDHGEAPIWRPEVLPASSRSSSHRFSFGLKGALVGAAVMLLVAWGTMIFEPRSLPSQPRLVESLPVLLETPPAVLFANLDDTFAAPSDALLPAHLTLSMP